MSANLFHRRIILSGLLVLTSLFTYADTAAKSNADPMTTSNKEPMSVKEHIIKWMLTDQKFVEKAAMSSRAEIELSKLALEKAQASSVRGFAKTMVQDHTAADSQLGLIAQAKNLAVPTALDRDHQEDVSRLNGLSDAQFDAAYIDIMRKDHEKAVSLFTAAANDDKLIPELRQFAQKTLPTLRSHEEHVRALATQSAAMEK